MEKPLARKSCGSWMALLLSGPDIRTDRLPRSCRRSATWLVTSTCDGAVGVSIGMEGAEALAGVVAAAWGDVGAEGKGTPFGTGRTCVGSEGPAAGAGGKSPPVTNLGDVVRAGTGWGMKVTGDSWVRGTVCCLRTSFCRGDATLEAEGAILEDEGTALGGGGPDWTSGGCDRGAAFAAAAAIFAWTGCLTASLNVGLMLLLGATDAGC